MRGESEEVAARRLPEIRARACDAGEPRREMPDKLHASIEKAAGQRQTVLDDRIDSLRWLVGAERLEAVRDEGDQSTLTLASCQLRFTQDGLNVTLHSGESTERRAFESERFGEERRWRGDRAEDPQSDDGLAAELVEWTVRAAECRYDELGKQHDLGSEAE